MPELLPGVMGRLFLRLGAEASGKGMIALELAALAVERQAKINASSGEHAVRTPTPAHPGSGPARISGTLVRSITHSSPERSALGWSIKVGPAGGTYPFYNRRTPSSKYGYYLETGIRNGSKYPWLVPALHMVHHVSIYTIFREVFSVLG